MTNPAPIGATLPSALEEITERAADHQPAATRAGVRDAWYAWLTQCDVTATAIVQAAIHKAVTEWLDRHGHEVFPPSGPEDP